jgi:hypothetical protein
MGDLDNSMLTHVPF